MDTPIGTHGGSPKVTLEGTYSPTDFFEEMIPIERPGYTATMNDGRIEVVFRESEPPVVA